MRLLTISGGRHPYEESTPVLERFLKGAGHDVTVSWDADVLSDAREMVQYDALVLNSLRANETALNEGEQAGLKGFIRGGKGFVCIHISGCVPDTWPEYRDITGGGWVMGTSFHPPYGQFTVNIQNPDHPGVAGISDFATNDELYMGIEYSDDNDVFMTADSEEGTYQWAGKPTSMPAGTFPLGWTRTYGDGKVLVTLLGHNGLSFETPEFQKMVLNGVDWATS
jgi:hypothetical protein